MDVEDDYPPPEELELESREPSLEDLKEHCAHLNELGALYLVVGGFSEIQIAS